MSKHFLSFSKTMACAIVIIGLVGSANAQSKLVNESEALAKVVSKVAPTYPVIAKQMKLAGNVQLQAVIDESGSVGEVTTVSGNPVLAKAGQDALKQWKFKPFTNDDGKPTKVSVVLSMAFKL